VWPRHVFARSCRFIPSPPGGEGTGEGYLRETTATPHLYPCASRPSGPRPEPRPPSSRRPRVAPKGRGVKKQAPGGGTGEIATLATQARRRADTRVRPYVMNASFPNVARGPVYPEASERCPARFLVKSSRPKGPRENSQGQGRRRRPSPLGLNRLEAPSPNGAREAAVVPEGSHAPSGLRVLQGSGFQGRCPWLFSSGLSGREKAPPTEEPPDHSAFRKSSSSNARRC
jgi:hypothetical protein